MPLIQLCGLPGVGKTLCAHQLRDFFEKQSLQVVVIGEGDLGFGANEAHVGTNFVPTTHFVANIHGVRNLFLDAMSEKIFRAGLKTRVSKVLEEDAVVIVDSNAHLRLHRFELYCLSREMNTANVVVRLYLSFVHALFLLISIRCTSKFLKVLLVHSILSDSPRLQSLCECSVPSILYEHLPALNRVDFNEWRHTLSNLARKWCGTILCSMFTTVMWSRSSGTVELRGLG